MNPFLSVRFRLFALCAGLLLVLGGANVLLGEINLKHESEVRLQQEQYRRVQVINGVLQAMSTYRYWWGQHNAAVMVKNNEAELQAREKRDAAQNRLEEKLEELRQFDRPTVATVSETIREFPGHLQRGIRALLRREPGAEDHLNRATRLLTAAENVLSSAAQREELLAERTQRQARDRAAFAMRLSLFVIAFSAGSGLFLTYLVLRSIVQPMQSTVKALRLVNAGETAIDLPPVSQDEFGDMALALRQFRDQAERLRRLAYRDSLTGAGNRTRLEESLRADMERSRDSGKRLALFYIDLDNFRAVNDSLGHSVGDRYLCEAVARLQRFAPEDALVCRYGGDKFTMLLSDLPESDSETTLAYLRRVSENILQGMAEPYQQGNDLLPMSVSIGIAIFPDDGQTGEQLVSSADAAMYLAKRQGRNNAQFATPELTGDARRQLAIVSDIRRGLESGEFEPFYQPIVDIVTRRVVGAEALLRWRHPQRGIVSAGDFIPAAEATGLIHVLSETCMVKACEQAKRWRNGHLRISVNLSARQIEDRTVIPLLERLHSGAVSGAPNLDFEITETAILRQIDRAEETLAQVRALGHALSLDDFGTGYSSLVYLQRFPINRIKIDRSFVARVEASREARAIISATVALAQSLNLDVVAEGVETISQLRELHALGCTLQQGYYFTAALPSAEFDAWRFRESDSISHTATA